MPNIKDSVYFVEVTLLFQRGGGWLIGMKGWGSCTIRMMVVCFLCQMQVRVGENPQWVVCLHVYTPRKIVSFSTPRQTGLIFPLRSCINLRN